MGNNRNSRKGNASNNPTPTPTPTPETTASLGAGTVSPAFGKPADVDQNQLAINEAIARKTTADAVITGTVKTDADADAVVLTTLESGLHRLGFKSAVEILKHEISTETVGVVYVNADSLAKMSMVGKTESASGESVLVDGGFVGIDTNNLKRLIVKVDRAIVAKLVAQNAKAPRTASGDNGYTTEMIYRPTTAHTGVNRIVSGNMIGGAGTITLSVKTADAESVVTINVDTAEKTLVTGTPAENGKARMYVYTDVQYADKSVERISSAWLIGLMNSLNARKQPIIGNNADAVKIVAPTPTPATETADASTESGETETDADASTETE